MTAATRHQLVWVTAAIRRAASEAGFDLPVAYARLVAADALARGDQVALSPLGAGMVLHTAPESLDRLPEVVGYADGGGQWYRDGSRHPANPDTVQTATDGFVAALARHAEDEGVSL